MTKTLKSREEQKREGMMDAKARWQMLMNGLEWAAKQPTAPRFDPASRIKEQNRKLQRLAQ